MSRTETILAPGGPHLRKERRPQTRRFALRLLDDGQRRGRAGQIAVALRFIATAGIIVTLSPLRTISATPSTVQNPAPAVSAYEFEVATIKPSRPGDKGGAAGFDSENTYRAKNFTMKQVIRSAYGLWGGGEGMVSGGPNWLDSDGYDITAKVDSSVAEKLKTLTPDQRQLARERMVQSLLADRLKLAIHHETREFPIYALTLAEKGSKLNEAKAGDTYENAFPYAGKFAGGGTPAGKIFLVGGKSPGEETLYAFGVSTFALARQLRVLAGRTVQDRTGLTGSYDFTLKWRRNPPLSDAAPDDQPVPSASDPGGSDLFKAIQQQLGLNLKPGKGPVDIIVIDHVERPSEN